MALMRARLRNNSLEAALAGQPQRVADPRKSIRLISWNCGGLTSQFKSILALLARFGPHVLLLQEAHHRGGNYAALEAECRDLGYTMASDAPSGMVTIWKRGLCIVPVKKSAVDEGFRIQRLAMHISGRRYVLRHVHGPHAPGIDRTHFFANLDADPCGSLVLDGGDFN